MDYSEYKFANYSRTKEDEKMHSLELNVLRSSRVFKPDDEIVVVQMSNLDGSTDEDEIGADENYNHYVLIKFWRVIMLLFVSSDIQERS